MAVPSDDVLHEYLLGTLSVEQAEDVQAWLASDPSSATRLDQIAISDPLTEACATCARYTPLPPGAIERISRGVSAALNRVPADDTPSVVYDDGTATRALPSPPGSTGWPPERLGQFRIVRALGHGGMGYVFEAEDEKLGRRVAVKVLIPEVARRSDAAARFLREARAAASVEHENVVPILHVGEEDGVPYIVMPLLKGESLADRLKRDKRLSVAEVTQIGRDVSAGLGAAHARGLVHRDVKPGNVWLEAETGRARVLDFGLARLCDGTDSLTGSQGLTGTPAYMAPEQLDGQPASARSDLFSLGATLYECATGQKAFRGPSITAVLNAVNACRPQPLTEIAPNLPTALADLIARLLKKNPADRPTDARDVAAALASGADVGAPGELNTTSWVDPTPRAEGHRSRRTWLAGAGVAVLLAFGVAVWQVTRPPTRAVADGPQETPQPSDPLAPKPDERRDPVRFRGQVDVRVARVIDGRERLLRLNEPGALPLQQRDSFVIDVEVEPAAYVYVVWVDPGRDVTPVYPWNPAEGWNTSPAKVEPVTRLTLPPNVQDRYRAPTARPGMATMVMFARQTPLEVPDKEVERWFKELPELELPGDGNAAAVWFENFTEVRRPNWLRTFGVVESGDTFARWQGQLQKTLGGYAEFQTAVSFARTGRK